MKHPKRRSTREEPRRFRSQKQSRSTSRSLAAERDQFKDIALRLQADFENYRKRVTPRHGRRGGPWTGRLVESLLPVLDACEAAFAHGADGVEPVWSALIGALQKAGLEAHRLSGQAFRSGRARRRGSRTGRR